MNIFQSFGVRAFNNWFDFILPNFAGGNIINQVYEFLAGTPAITTLPLEQRKLLLRTKGYRNVTEVERGGKKYTLTKINLFQGAEEHINAIIKIVAPWWPSLFGSVQEMDDYLKSQWVGMVDEIQNMEIENTFSFQGTLAFTKRVLKK